MQPEPGKKESILNVEADRPESSTRAVAHHSSVSHQTICRVVTGLYRAFLLILFGAGMALFQSNPLKKKP
ncbi:hypothetical protein TNCV_568591 [Trichonephila clavipes]|nr:hypothetical protein TNCV_568591 [Trichonephila clavipes]